MADLKLPKPKYGQIFALRKNGEDPNGIPFPLTTTLCRIGRNEKADIRVTSASVSQFHCNIVVDDETGQVSLETLNESSITELNDEVLPPHVNRKLNHKDIIRIGGRQLCFEYLPPDFQPRSNSVSPLFKILTPVRKPPFLQTTNKLTDNGSINENRHLPKLEDSKPAELIIEKSGFILLQEEKGDTSDEVATPPQQMLSTCPNRTKATDRRVSFGPYLSPEQFDNTLPPATPVKRGATPRKSTLYSSLKNMKSKAETFVEEDDEEIKSEEEINAGTLEEEALPIEKSSSEMILCRHLERSYNVEQPSETLETFMEHDDQPSNLDLTDSEGSTMLIDVQMHMEARNATYLQESQSTETECIIIRSSETSPKPVFVDVDSISDERETALSPETEKPDNVILEENQQPSEIPRQLTEDTQPDYSNVNSIKELLKTPQSLSLKPETNYTSTIDGEQLVMTPNPLPGIPRIEYTNIAANTQHLTVSEQTVEASQTGYNCVEGITKLKTPKLTEIAEADYTNVIGIKQLLATPKQTSEPAQADYTNVEGIKRLMKTPKLVETPKPDYTNVMGVKQLFGTPKQIPETPHADYTNVVGVKQLLSTPKQASGTPQADYTNVEGIQMLLKTPKVIATPEADYTNIFGVKQLLAPPKQLPKIPQADYTDVEGIKRLVKTPEVVKTRKADYTNVMGIKQLFATPEETSVAPHSDHKELEGIKRLVKTPIVVETSMPDYASAKGTDELGTPVSSNCVVASGHSDVEVKILFNTPDAERTGIIGIRRLVESPGPDADSTNVEVIETLMKTPKLVNNLPSNKVDDTHRTVSTSQSLVVVPTEITTTEGKEVLDTSPSIAAVVKPFLSVSSTEDKNSVSLNDTKRNEEIGSKDNSNSKEIPPVSSSPTKFPADIGQLSKETEFASCETIEEKVEHSNVEETECMDIKSCDKQVVIGRNDAVGVRVDEIEPNEVIIIESDSQLTVETIECKSVVVTTSKRKCRGRKKDEQENIAVLSKAGAKVPPRNKRLRKQHHGACEISDVASDVNSNNETIKADSDQNETTVFEPKSIDSDDLEKGMVIIPHPINEDKDRTEDNGTSVTSKRTRRQAASKIKTSQSLDHATNSTNDCMISEACSDSQIPIRITRHRAAKQNDEKAEAKQNHKNKKPRTISRVKAPSSESGEIQKSESHVEANRSTETRSRSAKNRKENIFDASNTVQDAPQQDSPKRALRSSKDQKVIKPATISSSVRVTRSKKEITVDSLPILKVSLVKLEEQQNSSDTVSVLTRRGNRNKTREEKTENSVVPGNLGKRARNRSPINTTLRHSKRKSIKEESKIEDAVPYSSPKKRSKKEADNSIKKVCKSPTSRTSRRTRRH